MKRIGVSLLSLCLAFVMLFALAGCGSKNDGTYYRVLGERVYEDWYVKISGNKWTMDAGQGSVSGSCEIDGETGAVTLWYTLTGENDPVQGYVGEKVALYKGTIEDGVLALTWSAYGGYMYWQFCLDGVVPKAS